MRNTIVVGLKERKQKVRSIILEADKQIKQAALDFPDSISKTRFLAAIEKAKDNLFYSVRGHNGYPAIIF